jgi:recombination protein RecT
MLDAPSIKKQFSEILKDNAATFLGSILDLFNTDSTLQQCEPSDLIKEALKAAVMKLPINKSLGYAYIIPYFENKNINGQWIKKLVPQFQIGYKGLIQMAIRTQQYKFINADAVFEGEFQRKDKLSGEFDMNGTKTSDVVTGYFAYIQMLNGFSKTLFMTKEQVLIHAKKYSKAYGNAGGPWQKDFDAMALKTVLRNLLSHYGYLSIEMVQTISKDLEDDSVEDVVAEEIKNNANSEVMQFTDAEVVKEDDSECPI